MKPPIRGDCACPPFAPPRSPRGTGRSDSPAGPFSHLEDLGALLDTLGIRRAALIGLSSGAALALDFALHAPNRVTALVLAAPSVPGIARSPEMDERVRGFGRSAELAPGYPEARETARALILENFRPIGPALARPLSPPAAERLAHVRLPVLVLVGEADHPDVQRRARILQRGIPGSRLENTPAAGHLLNLENPEALAGWSERFSPPRLETGASGAAPPAAPPRRSARPGTSR